MVDVSVAPFEIEVRTRHGDMVRADVYLPKDRDGAVPVLLGASPYQKALRHLPPKPPRFPSSNTGRCSSTSTMAMPMSRWTCRVWADPRERSVGAQFG